MRVLICGSRTFSDSYPIRLIVDGCPTFAFGGDGITIIEGGAIGADTLAKQAVDSHEAFWGGDNMAVEEYPADWKQHGKAAGPIRNKQMLEEGKPDVVWAFVDRPLAESRGTANMVEQAKEAGLPVYVVQRV